MLEPTMIVPSGNAPRTIPSDANGIPVSVQYVWQDEQSGPVPYSAYTERLLRPSGVLYGATGREYGVPVRNVGQFGKAIMCLDVHALNTPNSNEKLDVQLETSFDNGINWYSLAGFKQVNTAGKANQTIIIAPSGVVQRNLIENLNRTVMPSAAPLPSGHVELDYFGNLIRTSSIFTDPAGANASGIFSVYAAFKA